MLFWFNVQATYEAVTPPPVPTDETYYGGSVQPTDVGPTQPEPPSAYKRHIETTKVQGLLTGDGVRYLFTSFVSNFRNFAALAIILVVMLGVGLAETAGLIGAVMRKLVAASSDAALTLIIVGLGVVSSVASDAGYLVLIEGFFAVCRAGGLTGDQGVAIPRANVPHLMVADDVAAAVAAGDFHIWAVEHVDEGIELLTGHPAGARDADGAYPEDSVHRRVQERLRDYAMRLRAFSPGLPDGARVGPGTQLA